MAPLALVLLFAVLAPARAETDAERRAAQAAALSRTAALSGDPMTARTHAAAAFEGEIPEEDPAVSPEENQRRRRLRLTRAEDLKRAPKAPPPTPDSQPKSKLSTGLVLGGGAALGALQGFLSAGLIGALAGGVLGLGAAWLYTKGQHAAAFGATAGSIIGAALGGPIGGIIGAVVGAGIGFLVGKLFGM